MTGWRDGERWLALAVVVGTAYAVGHLALRGFLPRPFNPDPFDYWMDWFNTAYWAHDRGAYDSWLTLYPPVSFLLLKLFTLPGCYPFAEGTAARDCDWVGAVALHGWYLLDVVLIGWTLWRTDKRTAVPRAVALALGLPMLTSLDRGNLILICIACFLLAHGPLLRRARWRWVAWALTINLKVYLIATLAAPVLRGRWRVFEGVALAIGGVYLVSWGLLGIGTPGEVIDNLTHWSGQLQQLSSMRDVWFTTSYAPLVTLLNRGVVPIGAARSAWLAEVLPLAVRATQALVLAAAAATWARPGAVTRHRALSLTMLLALVTSESGGYSLALVMILTFLEGGRGVGVRCALVCCYLLAIPADVSLVPLDPQIADGFVGWGPVVAPYALTVGQLVRPGLVLLIAAALSGDTIAQVWRTVRRERAATAGHDRAFAGAATPIG